MAARGTRCFAGNVDQEEMARKRTEAAHRRTRGATNAKQTGVTTVEYAVMLALVALLVLTFGIQIGDSIKDTFNKLVVALGGSDDSGSGSGGGTAAGDTGSTGNNGRGNSFGNAPAGNGNGRGGNGNGNARGLN